MTTASLLIRAGASCWSSPNCNEEDDKGSNNNQGVFTMEVMVRSAVVTKIVYDTSALESQTKLLNGIAQAVCFVFFGEQVTDASSSIVFPTDTSSVRQSFKYINCIESKTYLCKQVMFAYTTEVINRSCRAVNRSREGGTLPRYRAATRDDDDEYVVEIRRNRGGGAIQRWVCMEWMEDMLDLEAQRVMVEKRMALARGIAVVHSCVDVDMLVETPVCPEDSLVGVDERGVWDWIGSVPSRLQMLNQSPIRYTSAEHIDSITRQEAFVNSADCVLPRYAGTGDLQLKNILGSNQTAIVPINVEILVPMSRLYDLVWLLILNDAYHGLPTTNKVPQERWMYDFASALQIYHFQYHKNRHKPFSPEEIQFFPMIVKIKVMQIATVTQAFMQREFQSHLAWIDNHANDIRSLMASGNPPNIMRSVPDNDGEPEHAQRPYDFLIPAFQAIQQQQPTKAIVLFMNGTFSPVHLGHMDSLEQAAVAVKRHFSAPSDGGGGGDGCQIAGALVSPCHPQYAEAKLGKENALSAWNRVSLLLLAVSSTMVEQHSTFVDTYETVHCADVANPKRFMVPFQRCLATASRVGMNPEHVVFCIVLGSDASAGMMRYYCSYHNQIYCCMMERSDGNGGVSLPPNLPNVIVGKQIVTNMSSTAIRKRQKDATTTNQS
eukprot:PhF_6_TR35022/c0_g1_i3/m.50996